MAQVHPQGDAHRQAVDRFGRAGTVLVVAGAAGPYEPRHGPPLALLFGHLLDAQWRGLRAAIVHRRWMAPVDSGFMGHLSRCDADRVDLCALSASAPRASL